MVSLIALSLLQERPYGYHGTQTWIDYANAVSAATGLEVRYTYYDNDKKTDTCTILAKGRDKVVWTVTGKSRFVWNLTDGIWIDDTFKIYLYFRKKSEFFAQCSIEIPGIIPRQPLYDGFEEESTLFESGRRLKVLSFGDQGIDTSDRIWFYFDALTNLPVRIERHWGGLWDRGTGEKRYEIDSFKLNAEIDDREFDLSPPPGYRSLQS